MNAFRVFYWVFGLLLIAFGVLAIFSIGAPFFALGVALIALEPFRDRPATFWPGISGVISFFVGYVLIAPLGCAAQATGSVTAGGSGTESGPPGHTTCTNLLGIDYSGSGLYNPPLWPAVIAGLVLAALVTVALHRLLRHRP